MLHLFSPWMTNTIIDYMMPFLFDMAAFDTGLKPYKT